MGIRLRVKDRRRKERKMAPCKHPFSFFIFYGLKLTLTCLVAEERAGKGFASEVCLDHERRKARHKNCDLTVKGGIRLLFFPTGF